MKNGLIRLAGATLYFTRWGEGSKVLLAFHGFGQTRMHYQPLAESLHEEYTVYACDLFFHGQSTWQPSKIPLQKSFWKELMEAFLKQEGIKQFGLVGFSMGGKFVLATLEAFAGQVTEIILIAPDGVKTSFWYSLATFPGWTEAWFRYITVKPYAFRNLVQVFRRLRVVDKGVLRFAESQMTTREQRLRVYLSWMVFRELRFDLREIAQLVNAHQTPLIMYLGKYDRIITRKNMHRLLRKVQHYQLIILPTGHNRLIAEVAEYYRKQQRWYG